MSQKVKYMLAAWVGVLFGVIMGGMLTQGDKFLGLIMFIILVGSMLYVWKTGKK